MKINNYLNLRRISAIIVISLFTISFMVSCDDDDDTTETVILDCETAITIPAATTPFSDDFQAYESFAVPSSNWTSITEKGLRTFSVITHQANNFVEMTAFNSDKENKTWLISPVFDFSSMIDKNMSFKLADALQNGNPLKVMYSNNYDGSTCPSDANFTWTEIGSSQISNLINNTENDDFNFESTDDIDLSAISGNAVIAFVYEGSGNGIVTKIQIDDVRIGQSLAFVPVLSISGTLEVGDTLTANYSPLVDVQGNSITVTYQWYRADDNSGTNETEIIGETNVTYLLANEDSGKYITVKATANSAVTTANYVGFITGFNSPPTASVIITGTAASGEILTADTSASTDLDGDPLTFTYQWYRADDIAGTGEIAIVGETNTTYTVADIDLGKFITVKVIANDGLVDSSEATASYINIAYSTNIFITELADPNNNTRGRFVELYNSSNADIDLSGWKLIRYTNGGSTPSAEEHHLAGTIAANSTFLIGKVSDSSTSTADFESIYGFAPDQAADPHSDGTVNKVVTPIDSNGDDQILLIAPNGAVMDIFGVIGQDGSGTAHEFEDGKAVRKISVTQSNPTWDSSEWDVWNDTGNAGTTNQPQNAPADFTPGVR
jgi:hypothetical protein